MYYFLLCYEMMKYYIFDVIQKLQYYWVIFIFRMNYLIIFVLKQYNETDYLLYTAILIKLMKKEIKVIVWLLKYQLAISFCNGLTPIQL